jgi:signal transduction histidine kinase
LISLQGIPTEQREAIEDSERAVRRADDMIADLLSVARAEHVASDADLLRRVLDNIVSNALRHMPKGGCIEARASSREVVELRIANSGRPFRSRNETESSRNFGARKAARRGTVGLGLYFCRVVVEAHGGRIAIEQTDRWPTEFVITLPVYQGKVLIQ